MIVVFLVIVFSLLFYLYPKTNIELKTGLRKMGKAGKQIGKGGNLGGENVGMDRGCR